MNTIRWKTEKGKTVDKLTYHGWNTVGNTVNRKKFCRLVSVLCVLCSKQTIRSIPRLIFSILLTISLVEDFEFWMYADQADLSQLENIVILLDSRVVHAINKP